ncbi:sugar kinase [Sulfitobacter sp. TSTF-M16]|uniref:Sugar kinase n=1 Tax=Sulfitobacter aestuariivivens TaxID=2766981 RepID=A0A927D8A5_9RHOB|nr:sugar kinase [Sulfitobacter aestuariivivens]MBD3666261.1 sugar kinase [Sulfitobacter aestuariivivens]
MRVLSIGECMAELSPTKTPGEFRLGFAGDTFNTAWYLAKIAPGIQVSYMTAVGDDDNSERMRHFMRKSGICDKHVRVIRDRTIGLYQIHIHNGERSFTYWRGQSAARQLAQDPAALKRAMDSADLIYFSGITLAILDEQSRKSLFSSLRRMRQKGRVIAFDTNLRPRLWTNSQDMIDTIMHAAGFADIIMPSFEDEAEWFGDASPRATLDRYKQAGADRIIVKNSDQSVTYFDHGTYGEVAVEAADDAIDTTAAGDSFNAGVLAEILGQNDLEQGILQGCALARQVVRQSGALVDVRRTVRGCDTL